MSLARISSALPGVGAADEGEGIVINPDVTTPVRTEEAHTRNSSTPHSRTTTTVTTVTTRTPTSTEVVKTTVAVTKDTAPGEDGVATLPLPTVTRCTTKETTITTGKAVVRTVEEHATTTSATAAQLSATSFDVL
ncbi:mucin-5AC-like [Thrips palmi]|uniref:Mucin-5AC-like n=1 Tax=Thrips palmi TaxID=161013 RepID=A0A6P8ZKU7_THRPL|nr:mucin-5AC-like [Thrips palmi]